jgi:hypothetical protein
LSSSSITAGNENRGSISGRDSGAAVKARHVSRLMFLAAVMHADRYLKACILWL